MSASDDHEMREKIQALQARIDAEKHNRAMRGGAIGYSNTYHRPAPYHPPYYPRGGYRGRGRGRGYPVSGTYRNRTLVVQNDQASSDNAHTKPQSPAKSVHNKAAQVGFNTGSGSCRTKLPCQNMLTSGSPAPQTPKKTGTCRHFSTTGQCRNGSLCPYAHDPSKVAICKEFLSKGVCQKGDYCDLSHHCTSNRVPPCAFYLRGSCTNDACRYAHVKVNPHAPVCYAFATLGYCDKGAECEQRHEYECPEYSSKGTCPIKNCRLPHIVRAGQLRQRTNAPQAANVPQVPQASGLSLLDSLDQALSSDEPARPVAEPVSEQTAPVQTSNFSQQDDYLSLTDDNGEFEQRFGMQGA